MKNRFLFAISCTLPLFGAVLPASAGLPGFTYLEDEAETNYDVTAQLKSLPTEWSLNEQENSDGYRLKITPNTIEMALVKNKTPKTLAVFAKGATPGTLVIQRRGPRWRLITEKRVLFEVDDDTFSDGVVGFRGGASDVKLQPTEEIALDDDFMRVANEVAIADARQDPRKGVKIASVQSTETIWKNILGSWSTSGITENPEAQVAQSANPFVFKGGAKGENLAVAGKEFWDDYSAEVSVKPEGAKATGLAVYVQDAKNYLLMRWPEAGPIQLLGVIDGKTRVLDATPLEWNQHQWYRLRLSAANGWVRGYVDDAEVVRARTGLFGRGFVGLYVDNAKDGKADDNAVFDDVSVRSIADLADDFSAPIPGRWKTMIGQWSINKVMAPVGTTGAFSVLGEIEWENYGVAARAFVPGHDAAGLVLHHRPGQGTYLMRAAGSKAALPYAGKLQIVKIAAGKTTTLAETTVGARFDDKAVDWEFSYEDGYLKALVDGVRLTDAFDDSLEAGRAGVFAQNDGKGTVPQIQWFSVEFPRPRPTWAKVPDLYTEGPQPQTMGIWSTPEGQWVPVTPIAPGGAKVTPISSNDDKTFWHKGAFWGDSAVRFKLPELGAEQKLNLVFGDPGRNSAMLALRVSGQTLKGTLSQTKGGATNELANGDVALEGKIKDQPVEVKRRGRFLIVRAGDSNKKLLVAKIAN